MAWTCMLLHDCGYKKFTLGSRDSLWQAPCEQRAAARLLVAGLVCRAAAKVLKLSARLHNLSLDSIHRDRWPSMSSPSASLQL